MFNVKIESPTFFYSLFCLKMKNFNGLTTYVTDGNKFISFILIPFDRIRILFISENNFVSFLPVTFLLTPI